MCPAFLPLQSQHRAHARRLTPAAPREEPASPSECYAARPRYGRVPLCGRPDRCQSLSRQCAMPRRSRPTLPCVPQQPMQLPSPTTAPAPPAAPLNGTRQTTAPPCSIRAATDLRPRYTFSRGAEKNSCMAPSHCTRAFRSGRTRYGGRAGELAQAPQGLYGDTVTFKPGRRCSGTSSPISAMVAAISCPGMRGYETSGFLPRNVLKSVPQIPPCGF